MTSVHIKLFRYFLTAGTAAIVDVGGFAILCFFPIPIAVSAVTSFCLATVVNYLLSSRCVFNQAPTMRGFGLFFVAAVGGLTINVSVTLAGILYLGVAPVLAKIVGVGTAFLLNFWLNLRVVFGTPSVGRNK
jgi:putative flippase GtrA